MPSEDTQFKPGQSGNPNGRPPLAGALRNYTKTSVAEAFNKLMAMTEAEIDELSRRPDTPGLEKIVARVILKAIAQGTFGEVDRILDRFIGKVPQKFEGELGAPGGIPLIPPTVVIHSHPSPGQKPES